jgi:hypothetical protein
LYFRTVYIIRLLRAAMMVISCKRYRGWSFDAVSLITHPTQQTSRKLVHKKI